MMIVLWSGAVLLALFIAGSFIEVLDGFSSTPAWMAFLAIPFVIGGYLLLSLRNGMADAYGWTTMFLSVYVGLGIAVRGALLEQILAPNMLTTEDDFLSLRSLAVLVLAVGLVGIILIDYASTMVIESFYEDDSGLPLILLPFLVVWLSLEWLQVLQSLLDPMFGWLELLAYDPTAYSFGSFPPGVILLVLFPTVLGIVNTGITLKQGVTKSSGTTNRSTTATTSASTSSRRGNSTSTRSARSSTGGTGSRMGSRSADGSNRGVFNDASTDRSSRSATDTENTEVFGVGRNRSSAESIFKTPVTVSSDGITVEKIGSMDDF